MRILGQIVFGIAILGGAFALLNSLHFSGLLAVVLLQIVGLINLAWFAVIIGLMICGMSWSKPGLVLAPIVFVALWICAAVVSQWQLRTSNDPKVWDRPTSPEASAQRTLIVEGFGSVDPKIIADGHVDRLIWVHPDTSTHRITGIDQVSLANGDACSADEKRVSPQLQNVGRSDECFKRRSLAEIPDGLVVEQIIRVGAGCCNETQARLRSGGKERVLFAWYQGQDYVLSYIPLVGYARHTERFGLDDIAPQTMISAIYGVTPAYRPDYGGPAPRPILSAAETLDQAETFAKQANVSPKSVAALLIAARDKGLVDERSIDIAASLVGHDYEGWNAVTDFAKELTNEQTELLLEKVLTRLETPNICEDCAASERVGNPSLQQWKLRERLSNVDAFRDRAIRIFTEHHDLAAWQYEGCLRIITTLAPQDAYSNYVQGTILPMLLRDDTPGFSAKAIAYLRAGFSRPTQEGARLAAKFDLVSDRDLKEYMTRIWSWQLDKLPQRNAPAATYAIAIKACERIARISDPALRTQNFGVDCPVPSRPSR